MLIFQSGYGLRLVLTLALLWTGPSMAASVVSVTSQSSMSVSDDGQCTLVEAFNASQDSAGGDCELVVDGDAEPLIIRLQSGATYLRTERLNLAFGAFDSIQIDGQGATIGRDPAATDLFSLMSAFSLSPTTLTLRDLTLRDGEAQVGAGLIADGSRIASLHLERVNFVNNQALGTTVGDGGISGALSYTNGGMLNIRNCRFQNNRADRIGGAMSLQVASGVISDTVFTGNTSDGSAGALSVRGSDLRIVRSTFSGNSASISGGAIDMQPNTNFVVEQSTFTENQVGFGRGGAIDVNGPMTIRNSLFAENSADSGGALYYQPTPLPTPALVVENSTFYANRATSIGGAIRHEQGEMVMIGATVVDNRAASGGGVFVANRASFSLDHSIIVDNSAASGADCVGSREASGGYSLLGSGCEFSALSTDIENAEPSVVDSMLRDNGGPTLTLAVTPGEAAHNGGDREYLQTTATDQRGFPRIAEGRVDIGAHEYAAEAVGFPSVVFETSFELDEPQRFFDRQAFLDATGAGDVTGPFPGNGTVVGEFTQSGITFAPFGESSLNFSAWTNALPDLGGPGGTNDLALNGLEEFDIRIQSPVTAFGFDFVDPDGDATPFNLLVCASTFDPNSASCPLNDIVFSMDFFATDTNRRFIGFQIADPFQQVSIREQTNSNTNEFFGHVFTSL